MLIKIIFQQDHHSKTHQKRPFRSLESLKTRPLLPLKTRPRLQSRIRPYSSSRMRSRLSVQWTIRIYYMQNARFIEPAHSAKSAYPATFHRDSLPTEPRFFNQLKSHSHANGFIQATRVALQARSTWPKFLINQLIRAKPPCLPRGYSNTSNPEQALLSQILRIY